MIVKIYFSWKMIHSIIPSQNTRSKRRRIRRLVEAWAENCQLALSVPFQIQQCASKIRLRISYLLARIWRAQTWRTCTIVSLAILYLESLLPCRTKFLTYFLTQEPLEIWVLAIWAVGIVTTLAHKQNRILSQIKQEIRYPLPHIVPIVNQK